MNLALFSTLNDTERYTTGNSKLSCFPQLVVKRIRNTANTEKKFIFDIITFDFFILVKIYIFNAFRVTLVFITLLLFTPNIEAQSRQVRKAEKHKEKVDKQEEKKYEKSRKEAIKAHFDNQSDATKEQMKESKKKSKKFNSENQPGFFQAFMINRKANKEHKKRSKQQKRR
jgi:hypothetical protein